MNVNCKVTLTDEQRNNIKCHITGKLLKGLATRAEVCELINELLEPYTGIYVHVALKPGLRPQEPDQAEIDFADDTHDDCCRSNALLRTRLNKLQHRLDTRRN